MNSPTRDTIAKVMDKDYEVERRVRVTCPRCGGAAICRDVQYNVMTCMTCTLDHRGRHFAFQWASTSLSDRMFKTGDDSRLYRNEWWIDRSLYIHVSVQIRIMRHLREFRKTGRVPDFPGMGEK